LYPFVRIYSGFVQDYLRIGEDTLARVVEVMGVLSRSDISCTCNTS